MAGRIREESIQEVREKAPIDEVVSQYVTLKNAGGGSMKGLCPFHDEKTPSFNVNVSRQFFHCFGCQEGGDVIYFLMKMDGLTFVETVERLAEKYGVELKREEGDFEERPRDRRAASWSRRTGWPRSSTPSSCSPPTPRRPGSSSPSAASTARRPRRSGSASRRATARCCSGTCGPAASARRRIVAGGLAALSQRGGSPYDRFRGRLLWPIREASGETIGFGARRIFEDDKIEAKYLNTSETPIYKKSKVLYGIDLARQARWGGRRRRSWSRATPT